MRQKDTDKPKRIMAAAERLFTSRRFHEIKMDDIAKAARVSKGTLYLYFSDKDDLFRKTATAGLDELCQCISSRIPPQGDFAAQMLAASREIRSFFEHRAQFFRMMQSEDARMPLCRADIREEWLRERKKLVSTVSRIVEKGIADGSLRTDLSAETLAEYFLGMLRTQGHHLRGSPHAPCNCEQVLDLFLSGARAPDGRTARQHRPPAHGDPK